MISTFRRLKPSQPSARGSRPPTVLVALTLLAALLATPLSHPLSAADLELFRYWKSVRGEKTDREEVLAAILDGDVYDETRDKTPDLRVVDETSAEIPYQLEALADRREVRTFHAIRAQILALQEGEQAIQLRLRRAKDTPPVESLRFASPLHDLQRTVRVFGSDDGETWQPLVAGALIFDYRRFADLRQMEVPLPENRFHEFKVVIEQAVDEQESPYRELTRTLREETEQQRTERQAILRRPFRIDAIDFLHSTSAPRVNAYAEHDYTASAVHAEHDSRQKRTIITVTTHREPLDGFELQTNSRNFYRAASVQVADPEDPTRWVEIGQATLTRLRFRGIEREQLRIRFGEHQARDYRIVIEDQDNPPLEITGVVGKGKVYRAVFLAAPGHDYRLFYGSESATTPRYDTTTVLLALRKEVHPIELTLGEQQENTGYGGEPRMIATRILNNWVFLGIAIAVAAGVLGYSLFRAGSRMQALNDPRAGGESSG